MKAYARPRVSDIGPIPGLGFFVVAIATAGLGVVGLLVQAIVVAVLRFTRKGIQFGAWDDVALAALGPIWCLALGGFALLLVDEVGRDHRELLDTISPGLPLLGIALWIAAQLLWVARRARRAASPSI